MLPKYWIVLFSLLFVADLVYLNYRLLNQAIPQSIVQTKVEPPTTTLSDQCGPVCQKIINDKINEFKNNLPTPVPTTKNIATTRVKTRSTSYLPIPGNGSIMNNDWASLTGTDFYFDSLDYPGLVSIYFETNAHLFNGNGTAFVRLYDATNNVGVVGSDVQTNNQADTAIISGQIRFYAGKNLIRVQAKSLTADTAIFSSGRLKITTEN